MDFWQAFLSFLSQKHAKELFELARLTESTARRMNITAHKSFDTICVYHILDSMSVSDLVADGMCVCDVGTGGGFPGLVLAILHPNARFTLLDATEKKVRAVEDTARDLGLSNVRALCGRAEELGAKALRERFDLCVSRAVAPLDVLSELCLPLVKTGGLFCAMKGRRAAEEQAGAGSILHTLGASLFESRREALDPAALLSAIPIKAQDAQAALLNEFCAMERHTLIYEKKSPTPKGYPRSFARIKQATSRAKGANGHG